MAREVRVRTRGGVPQVCIDGRPTRARIFFGGANAAPVAIGPEPRAIAFAFRAPLDTDTATLHFRFGQSPGTVRLHGLEVIEDGAPAPIVGPESLGRRFADDWNLWPPDAKNTVGAVRSEADGIVVTLSAPPDGLWPDFHLHHDARLALRKGRRYRVRVVAAATPARALTIALYQPGVTYTFLAGPSETFDRQVRHAAAAGVNLVSFEMPLPWPEPGQSVDWRAVEAVGERVLAANPDALLLPRIGLYPPPWWLQANPDAVMRWDDGDHGGLWATVSSPDYRRDAAARLTALIDFVEARFGDHVAGYHPTGQNTGEWFWMDTWERGLGGYAPADRDAWNAWRRQRKLPAAPVPTPPMRRAATPSPVVREWNAFLSETMAETVCRFARVVRRATRGRRLSVFFYGYGFEFAPAPNGPAASGHYALRRVLKSPDIDILCGPFSYFDRAWGQSGPVMSAAESVALAGKLWLNEDDTRTYLAAERHLPGFDSGADNREKTQQILRRNLVTVAQRNQGIWWMDLPGTGWFDDALLWDVMRAFEAIDRHALEHPTPFRPEVALVLDEEAVFALGPDPARNAPLSTVRAALGRLGAPYGQYLIDDVFAGRCSARLLVVVLADALAPTRRRALERAARGRCLVLVGPDGIGVEALHEAARRAGVTRRDGATRLGRQGEG